MKITLYHEVDPSNEEKILQEGIHQEAEGEKTDDENKKVDAFLDENIPPELDQLNVRRDEVIYAYMEYFDSIIDIRDGEYVPVDEFVDRNDQTLLKLTVDSGDCFVSDLDTYDTLLNAMEADEYEGRLKYLAAQYWDTVIPYDKYELGTYDRPEILITQDVSPSAIEVVK